jgi:hypothetical protein
MRMGLTLHVLSTPRGFSAASSDTITLSTRPTKEVKLLRLVVAIGGNALQQRGDRLTIENMLKAAAVLAPTLAELVKTHQVGKMRFFNNHKKWRVPCFY